MPLINDFNHQTAQKIFNGDYKSQFIMFLSKEAGHYDEYAEKLKESAKKFRGQVMNEILNKNFFVTK